MPRQDIEFRSCGEEGVRTTFKLVAAGVALIILSIAVQLTVAFIRTPDVVARAEQSGNLRLELSDFQGERLQ